MSAQRRNVVGSKRPREVFLTSTSLSFSSLSSSCASWDDGIEISMMKTSRTSYEISCVQQPSPSSPSRLRPVRLMDECLGTHYDPERIPASVFAKSTGDANWSEASNDSLFSLRMSTCQAFRESNIEDEAGEFLAYSPYLLVKTEEAKEKRSQVKETKTHQEKSISSSTPPVVSWSSTNYPTSFYQLYQAPQTKAQSCPLPVGDKRENKKKKIIWSWFSSGFFKYNLHCCSRSRELYKN
ncbi:uncharacterized protein LOC130496822 [Raphanus sativus]|uniref:Uncharacterized protein LOC108843743 n=1 Tax=Raphanus sativus TaxID=3726 RepID=A0A6J0MJ30_RAPSA|nr:uncharacterized protein LOC108843743 [Raphanus sativus]XP_056845314.1 uncharacterized protein LOC130496822 [Raphanus sativus]